MALAHIQEVDSEQEFSKTTEKSRNRSKGRQMLEEEMNQGSIERDFKKKIIKDGEGSL